MTDMGHSGTFWVLCSTSYIFKQELVKLLHVEYPTVICKQKLRNRNIPSRIHVQYITVYYTAAHCVFYKNTSSSRDVKYSTKDFRTRQIKNISTYKILISEFTIF
jgi:hypothetical protein